MKTGVIRIIFALGLLAVFASCRDPIFYYISQETPREEPRIKGAPTNMVVWERDYPDPEDTDKTITVRAFYVASGGLHWYAKDSDGVSRWNWSGAPISQPGGRVIALAATDDYLYALTLTGHGVDTKLKRLGREWKEKETWDDIETLNVGSYTLIQSIYADRGQDRVFAGARLDNVNSDQYAILYLYPPATSGELPTMQMLQPDTGLLSGAVYRDSIHYLSTRGKGIFQISETNLTSGNTTVSQQDAPSGSKDRMFMGMIKLKDETIIVVERDGGAFYEVRNGSFARMTISTDDGSSPAMQTGNYATGALALWAERSDPDGTKLIVAGLQGGLYNTMTTSYTHGYVEFELDSTGKITRRRDPGDLLSVDIPGTDGNARYRATIGTKPINHLFQAPPDIDNNMTFFASTQNTGLWSFKERPSSGGWQWNAEN